MADEVAIKVEKVSKTFKLPHEKNTSIKSAVVNFYRRKRSFEAQEVLKNVSFEIKKGEFFGIVGRNGSGKSTLLKMLAGIYIPTDGEIHVKGKLTPFIELGVGFNPELTGRENVFLNGALLGFNRSEMQAMYDDIVSFAELERFMDQKLKNYSSGMQVRLAFSIAIRANTDILLLDEVLAVGDAVFQQKCFDYFKELKKEKKTVVFVSHDANALLQYCDRGILIENGELTLEGVIQDVVHTYQDILAQREEKASRTEKKRSEKRWGNLDMEVQSIATRNQNQTTQQVYTDKDETVEVAVKYRANKDCEQPIYGIVINDSTGQQLFASNTRWSHIDTLDIKKGETQSVIWDVPNIFNTGNYSISPAVANNSGAVMYDWRDGLTTIKVRKKIESTAQVNVAHKVRLESKG
jgi:ABC-2 type transport system ATP-binding protein